MIVLIMSEPQGSLADKLLQSDVDALLCVTQCNVHFRTLSDGIVSGEAIETSERIITDLPALKEQLLKAYPLIDRWVSKKQSVSTTIELMLEYTSRLIAVISNHRPHCAVLETGAPHHLFSYCLDVALNYLRIPAYYLYGNAIDGRCIVVKGIEKISPVAVTDYSAASAVNDLIAQVQRNASYTPLDSLQSLAPFWHAQPVYTLYIRLRQAAARCYFRRRNQVARSLQADSIKLCLPPVTLWDHFWIITAHYSYLRLIRAQEKFDISQVESDDIVYVGHMLPEATSFPDSRVYPGEIDVLLDLRNRFPDSKIFYREHPAISIYSEFGHIHLQGLHKNPFFYQQLNRLGIKVISPSIHISKLREKGCVFATKTGRVAIENSILGIPTLIYGFPFYGRSMPLTFAVDDLEGFGNVQQIKLNIKSYTNPAQVVGDYLKIRFSGSIPNPGIGLGKSSDLRAAFENEIKRFLSLLLQ